MYKVFNVLIGITLITGVIPVFAIENEQSLARASLSFFKKNHFANYVSIPFEEDINHHYNSTHKNQNTFNVKPVIPVRLNSSFDLIIRTIAPIYETVPLQNPPRTVNGIGDINPTFFITPRYFKKWIVGIGPTVFVPSTTNATYIASNKWSTGPELAAMAIDEHWMYGILTYNVFSTSVNSNAIKPNQFSLQYLVAYTFDNGWYLSTNPNIIANWRAKTAQRWTVPVGLGIGKALNTKDHGINLSTHFYYNAIRPEPIGPTWQLQLELELLFPALA